MKQSAHRATILFLFSLISGFGTAHAQQVNGTGLRIDLHQGSVTALDNNELNVDSTVDDPPAVRLGALKGGGKWSGDIVIFAGDGRTVTRRTEIVLLQFRQDERVRNLSPGDPRFNTGCITLHLRDGSLPGDDAQMVKVLELCHDYMWTPWFDTRVQGGPETPTDRMVSTNGRFVTVQQGDGNFVTYDTNLGVLGDPHAAVWSAWGGRVQ